MKKKSERPKKKKKTNEGKGIEIFFSRLAQVTSTCSVALSCYVPKKGDRYLELK
jgi:hypothetical protein